MMRKVLATIAGVLTGGIVVGLGEYASRLVYPLPAGVDMRDVEAMRAAVAALPPGAFAGVLLSWAMGSLVGGWVAAKISSVSGPALAVGAIQLAFGIVNMVTIPSPVWFMVAGCLLFVPSAWLGARLARPAAA